MATYKFLYYNLTACEIHAFCLLLLLCFVLNLASHRGHEVRYFTHTCLRTMLLCAAGLAADSLQVLTSGGHVGSVVPLFVATVFYSWTCMYVPYATFIEGQKLLLPERLRSWKFYALASLPFWLSSAVVILSLVNGQVLRAAADGRGLEEGPLFWLPLAIAVFYEAVLVFGPILLSGSRSGNREMFSPLEQTLLAVGAGLPIFMIPLCGLLRLPAVGPAYAMGLFFIIITFQQRRSSLDPLTGLNNRNELQRHLARLYAKGGEAMQEYCIIFLDLDHFKAINDRYGHAEGDMALLRFSRVLMDVLSLRRDCFFCRYGGDEFVIVVRAPKNDEVNDLIAKIQKRFDRDCAEHHAPYELSMSAGFIRYSDSMGSPRNFISAADERMYSIKRRHHEEEGAPEPAEAVTPAEK